MQKRFTPDAGGVFPEWEEIEFGKLFQRRSEQNGEEFGVDKTISVATMHFKPEGNKADEKSLPKYKVMRTGDIAFEGNINKHFKHGRFVLNDIGDGIISPIFEVLQPVSELSKEVPEFWKYYINYEPVMGKILAKCANTGIMMNRLAIKDFYKLKIKVPCIEEQRKIAAALASYDEMIAVKTAKLETWQECKKRMVKEIFGRTKRFRDDDGNEFPEWEEKTLGEIAEIFDGVHQTPKYTEEGIKFVSVENIENLIGSKKYISKDAFEKNYKNNIPKKNDIFMTRIGDVGRVALIETDEQLAFYVSLALVRTKNCSNVSPKYLLYAMESKLFQSELWKRTLHAAFPKKINMGEIGNCKIMIPKSLEEQQKIGSFLAEIDKEIEIQKEFIKTYAEGKKRMMRELMEG